MSLNDFIENKKNLKNANRNTIDFSGSFNKSPLDKLLFKENMKVVLPVNKIYFLQEQISSFFNDGSSIHKKDPSEITHLEVLYNIEENKLYSINNRSLYVLKKNKIEMISCVIRLRENHESIYLRRNVNCDGTRITIIYNFEIFLDEFRSLDQRNSTNFNYEDFLKHKINFKKQNKTMIDEVKFDDEYDSNQYLTKKRKRNDNEIEDLLNFI
jgi:hypothetical protein